VPVPPGPLQTSTLEYTCGRCSVYAQLIVGYEKDIGVGPGVAKTTPLIPTTTASMVNIMEIQRILRKLNMTDDFFCVFAVVLFMCIPPGGNLKSYL
jgi:hypothetical protein